MLIQTHLNIQLQIFVLIQVQNHRVLNTSQMLILNFLVFFYVIFYTALGPKVFVLFFFSFSY